MLKNKISVVFPVYYDERIYKSVARIIYLLEKEQIKHEVIVSGMLKEIDNLGNAIFVQTSQRGKGLAVREGVLQAEGEVIIICDADFPVSEKDFIGLLCELKDKNVVFGDRRSFYKKDKLNYSMVRRFISNIFNKVVGVLFSTKGIDTQCGLKGFRADKAKLIYSYTNLNGFLSDIEIVLICKSLMITIYNFSITWKHIHGSTVSLLFDTPQILIDFFKLMWVKRITREERYNKAIKLGRFASMRAG